MTFKELNIIEPILQALTEKGYSTPTPIQEQAILPAIDHQDILGLAQTGTGKTAAFSIPIIQHLHLDSLQKEGEEKIAKRAIRALILTPTRELAIQIGESLKDYTRYTDLQYTVIFGGVKQGSQVNRLKAGVDILVATPGRLLDLMHQGHIKINKIGRAHV